VDAWACTCAVLGAMKEAASNPSSCGNGD
jgi:hypothetical protein